MPAYTGTAVELASLPVVETDARLEQGKTCLDLNDLD